MKTFSTLTLEQKESLYKYPCYISLLAANKDGKMGEREKKTAIKLSHIRTYSCNPLLTEFYYQADKYFEENIKRIDSELPKEKEQRDKAIKIALTEIEATLLKLDAKLAATLKESMKSFKDHVSRAHNNVLQYLIFPVSLSKI